MSAAVTVIVPCFNQGHYLRDCISSLQAQTRSDWRAIVVDDRSTDGRTPALCDAEAEMDGRVTVIHEPVNRGRCGARRAAAALADTLALLPLDADDVLRPTYLQNTLAVLEGSPEVGLVYVDYERFGDRTGRLRGQSFSVPAMYKRRYVWAGSLIRVSAYRKSEGYRDLFRDGNEDYDLFLQIVEAGFRGVYLPEALLLYRSHGESWTSSKESDDRVFRTRLLLYEQHRAGFDRHGATAAFLGATFRDEGLRLAAAGRKAEAHAMFKRALGAKPWSARLFWLWLATW